MADNAHHECKRCGMLRNTVVVMGRVLPSDDDRRAAAIELLDAVGRGEDLEVVVANAGARHPKYDTFPGEVFLDIARDALELAGATRGEPIDFGRVIELIDWPLRGRRNAKLQYTILAAAAGRGGIEPDLLAEVQWRQTDDFWFYATLAAAGCIRAAAASRQAPVASVGEQLASHWT